MEIINLDVLQARIYILERDGGNLAKNQPVVIKLDAIPDKEYHGSIRTVSSVAASMERNSCFATLPAMCPSRMPAETSSAFVRE